MLKNFLKPINQFRKSYLPGIITGSADDDPSSISTYSIAGVTTGFSQLWLLLLSTPLLIAVFSMSARIGDVTKHGLITLIGQKYGRKTSLLCLVAFVITSFFILIADVIGMSAGMQLITGENYIYFIIPALVLIWYIVVFDNYKKILRYFSWLSGILLAYIFSGILAGPNWLTVIKSTFIPRISFNLTYFAAAIGLLGATFAPYAFFWETDEEIAEEKMKDLNALDLKGAKKIVAGTARSMGVKVDEK